MEIKIPLTNEKVCKKFKSQFDLVNYAIKLAENMIKTGRESRIKIDSQNRALQILAEIVHGKDQFDEIVVDHLDVEESGYERRDRQDRHERSDRDDEGKFSYNAKNAERKKARKILAG